MKTFAILILFCFTFSVHAEFQQLALSGNTSIEENETTAKTSASFKSSSLHLNMNFELKPEKKLKTFGVKYSPVQQVSFYYGQLSFSGLYGRVKTPCFSTPGALSSASSPSAGISITMPSSGTSATTPKAACFKLNLNSINLTYFERHKTAKTEHDEHFAEIDWHPPRTRLYFTLFGGSFESEKQANSRWFLATRPYAKEKIKYAGFESIYNSSYFKVHSINNISTSPYERITGTWRFCTTVTNRFFRLDSGFFWCDADHITVEESLLRKTMAAYVHPQLKSVTLKNGHKIRSGLTFSAARTYSDGMSPECTTRADLAFAVEYRTALLTFTMNLKCENAQHGADSANLEEIADERAQGKNVESKSLFKFMDFNTANAFLCYTDKTANVLGFGFKAFPVIFGHTQQLNLDADFKVFPFNGSKNAIDAAASFTFNPTKRLSIYIKQSADFSAEKEQPVPTNLYYIDSIKTELKAKMSFTYKNSTGYLTAKATFKKELEDNEKLVILFYCGATFYIKP